MNPRQSTTAVIATIISIGSTTVAWADTAPKPAIAAYHEYQAAKDRGDLQGVEMAAKRALAASEADDGGGGATAVLAMNLALAEIDLGHKQDAITPVRRALELSKAGAKGVDQLAARLVLGEAELSVNPTGDEDDLLLALEDSDSRKDIDNYAFPAAVALANAAKTSHRPNIMLAAWTYAERHIAGSDGEIELAKGRILTEQAVALVALHEDGDADRRLFTALAILGPLAPEASDDQETVYEVSYAEALAVLGAERSRQQSENSSSPALGSRINSSKPEFPHIPKRSELKDQPALCSGMIIPTPFPTYPKNMIDKSSVGAAILKFKINMKGEILSTKGLAVFPDSSFLKSAVDSKIKWKFKKSDIRPDCRLESSDYIISVFSY